MSIHATPLIDANRQKQAIALARDRRRALFLYAIIIAIIVASLIIWALQSPVPFALIGSLISGLLATPVLNWQLLPGWSPLLVFVFFVLARVLLLILAQPFIWYFYFVIPRRYGWHKNVTTWVWWRSRGKVLLISSVKMWLLVEVAILLMALQPRTWWLWTTLVQFLFSLLLARFGSRWLLPRLVKITPLPEGELTRRLTALLDRLHLPPCDIFVLASSGARAFFAGWGRGRCIVLTNHLVRNFTLDEIEVILAHELAHLVHHDIWKRLFIRSLAFLSFFFLVNLFISSFTTLHNIFANLSLDTQSLALLLFGDFLLLIGWFLISGFLLLERRYRRYSEYQADEFALHTTDNVQAFKDAMTRLTNMNMLRAQPTRYARWHSTHPSLVDRLKHADAFALREGQGKPGPFTNYFRIFPFLKNRKGGSR